MLALGMVRLHVAMGLFFPMLGQVLVFSMKRMRV